MKESIIIIGAGGHASVLIDTLSLMNVSIIGIVDKSLDKNKLDFQGIPIIGTDDEVMKFDPSKIQLVNAIGSTGVSVKRREIYESYRSLGYSFKTVIHPSAVIAKKVQILAGTVIMAGAIIQPGCKIGENCIINTKASIDHDCTVYDHVHIAPGVTICGDVTIGQSVHIGAGSTIIQGKHIGREAMIGASTLVNKNVSEKSKVIGVPGREVNL